MPRAKVMKFSRETTFDAIYALTHTQEWRALPPILRENTLHLYYTAMGALFGPIRGSTGTAAGVRQVNLRAAGLGVIDGGNNRNTRSRTRRLTGARVGSAARGVGRVAGTQ